MTIQRKFVKNVFRLMNHAQENKNGRFLEETAVFHNCRGSGIRTHDLADPNGAR